MNDEIVIASALGEQVRIHAARSTDMVNAAREAHSAAPTCTAALGRTLTVTGLISSDLKEPSEHVRVRINGGGPMGILRTEADGRGNVRGCADRMDLYASRADGHLDVGRVVGHEGTLQVSRDMGLKEPFTGTVLLTSGEIGEDFARYFAESEQIPSVVSVGVLVGEDTRVISAGGMLIQLLPFAQEEVISKVEFIAAHMKPMSEYMREERPVEDLIRELFPDARILDHKPLRWHCDCSKEHFADALSGLREQDLVDMIQEDHGAEIVCHYCRKAYRFSEEELNQLVEKKRANRNR